MIKFGQFNAKVRNPAENMHGRSDPRDRVNAPHHESTARALRHLATVAKCDDHRAGRRVDGNHAALPKRPEAEASGSTGRKRPRRRDRRWLKTPPRGGMGNAATAAECSTPLTRPPPAKAQAGRAPAPASCPWRQCRDRSRRRARQGDARPGRIRCLPNPSAQPMTDRPAGTPRAPAATNRPDFEVILTVSWGATMRYAFINVNAK